MERKSCHNNQSIPIYRDMNQISSTALRCITSHRSVLCISSMYGWTEWISIHTVWLTWMWAWTPLKFYDTVWPHVAWRLHRHSPAWLVLAVQTHLKLLKQFRWDREQVWVYTHTGPITHTATYTVSGPDQFMKFTQCLPPEFMRLHLNIMKNLWSIFLALSTTWDLSTKPNLSVKVTRAVRIHDATPLIKR